MRISTRGRYGLRALVFLAQYGDDSPISLSAIAEEEKISLNYLEQLMRTLRLDEIVVSKRGAKGGYLLARAPEDISVGEILRSLEGDISFADCNEPELCESSKNCSARQLWVRIENGISDIVDKTSLADLL